MILRELFVALGLDVDEAAFAKGQLAAELVKASLFKLYETAKSAVEAFVENTHAVVEYGDRINKTSQTIGIAKDALQELEYAAGLADISSDELSASLTILNRNLVAASKGGEEQSKAFAKLGVKVKDAQGKLRSADDVLADVADKFKTMEDGPEQAALAMDIFGKSGARLIPFLNQGGEKIDELRQEARALGLVIDDDLVEGSEELNDTLTQISAVTTGLWRQAVAPLIPVLTDLAKRFLEWRKANAAIISQRIQVVIGGIVKVAHLLGDTFAFLVDNATAVKIVLGTIGITGVIIALAGWMAKLSVASVAAAAATARAWIAAAAPFVAIAAIVAGFLLVFDDIRGYLAGEDSLYGTFKAEIDDWLKPKSDDPWFVTALKDFIRFLTASIELLRDVDEIFGDGQKSRALIDKRAGANRAELDRMRDNQTIETARQRTRQGLPLTAAETAALGRQGVKPESFVARYSGAPSVNVPTARAPQIYTPEPLAPAADNANTIGQIGPFYQQPGENQEMFVQRIGEVVDAKLQTKIDAAIAGVRR